MTLNSAVVEIKDLTKSYGQIIAVKNLTVQVRKGSIHGFLGPNGAGKTTTLRCCLGLLKPDSGTISILGENIGTHPSELLKKIGYLPGEVHLYSYYTVKEQLDYFQTLYGLKEAPLRANLVKRLHLDEKKKNKALSKGNKQKVGLIQALMHDPDVLILDEPTSGLDPLLQEEVFSILTEFQNRGKTIFFSSHILTEIDRICDTVSVIRKGQLIATQDVHELSSQIGRKIILRFKNQEFANGFVIEGLNFIEQEGMHYIYHTNLPLATIIPQILSKKEIIDFSLPAASVEDYFMQFYK